MEHSICSECWKVGYVRILNLSKSQKWNIDRSYILPKKINISTLSPITYTSRNTAAVNFCLTRLMSISKLLHTIKSIMKTVQNEKLTIPNIINFTKTLGKYPSRNLPNFFHSLFSFPISTKLSRSSKLYDAKNITLFRDRGPRSVEFAMSSGNRISRTWKRDDQGRDQFPVPTTTLIRCRTRSSLFQLVLSRRPKARFYDPPSGECPASPSPLPSTWL